MEIHLATCFNIVQLIWIDPGGCFGGGAGDGSPGGGGGDGPGGFGCGGAGGGGDTFSQLFGRPCCGLQQMNLSPPVIAAAVVTLMSTLLPV